VRTLRALEPLTGVVALFGAAMAALWLLVSNDVTLAVIPPPETEAESLVRALDARRFAAFRSELTESLRKEVDDETLKLLSARIESSHKGISEAHGTDTRHQDSHRATATVEVELGDRTAERIELPLIREHGLWRVASIEPLGRLTR
jgi:hypothetical protein